MALLFLKRIIFPRLDTFRSTSYTQLHNSPSGLPRRDSSSHLSTSSLSSSPSWDSEKGFHHDISDSFSQTSETSQSTNSTFTNRLISDVTIGLSDGLTVPFALTAGLSALGSSKVVVYGGMAELIAGAISMGLGGYLGARSEAEAYISTLTSTRATVLSSPHETYSLLISTLATLRLPHSLLSQLLEHLASDADLTTTFLMTFHHNLPPTPPAPSAAYMSGLTIALGYFVGGFVPLLPYLFVAQVGAAFHASVVLMAIALFVFGWTKQSMVAEGEEKRISKCIRSGFQMVVMGGLAACAAIVCVRALSGSGSEGQDSVS